MDEQAPDEYEEMFEPRSYHSVMFSPADPSVVVVSACDSVQLFDIRNLEEYKNRRMAMELIAY